MTTAELLLHPVRLRVVKAFLGGRDLTTLQLRELLPDVATATLYRQVATLVEAGILEIVDERRVRGAAERTYRLRTDTTVVGPEAVAQMSVEQHRAAFAAFVAGLLADFDNYLERGDINPASDLVGYRQVALHLTDEELVELITELRELIARRMALSPEGRTRRLLTTILMPAE
ncbi:helix-turn-helix domain-containing protein [Luedemannella helvata]|uniref:Helix-turn-helix domain-containing protein n=1 Tax=Luedemannella helvata TaxID=349315 RepID=A0ABP4XDN4_9ACTN